jgi:hypothetical protein
MNNRGKIATFELLILLIGIVAFAGIVSAGDNNIEANMALEGNKEEGVGILAGVYNMIKENKKDIATNFIYATTIYLGTKAIAKKYGEGASSAAANAATTAYITNGAVGKEGWLTKIPVIGESKWATFLTAHPIITTVVISAIVFVATFKSEKKKTIVFECKPWDAPTGGSKCEQCNTKQGDLPCSEYQCRSLGQGCELIEGKCVWVNEKDTKYPVMTLDSDVLLEGYQYSNDNAVSPPNRGVEIINEESESGCTAIYTPLVFGVNTDEPAKCKYDLQRTNSFDEMMTTIGSGLPSYNHTIPLSFQSNRTDFEIQNGGNYEIYIRCQDANGNENPSTFVFKFCVEQGPDTTPPLILASDLIEGGYFSFEQEEVALKIGVNEPVKDCKWSKQDVDYVNMEHPMSCVSSEEEVNLQMLYPCTTTLTGLEDRKENKFYFKCEDIAGNIDDESTVFTLVGTEPLVIDSISPENETIRGNKDAVDVDLEVETSAGAEEGIANCYYSSSGEENSYILFLDTDSYKHKQRLELPEGDYDYFIKCIDGGGNTIIEEIEFDVESDANVPIVVRAYNQGEDLKIVTNEEAECAYSKEDCSYSFNDGISFTSLDDKIHYADWDTQVTYYIKCRDEYGNQPAPDECNIVVKASD